MRVRKGLQRLVEAASTLSVKDASPRPPVPLPTTLPTLPAWRAPTLDGVELFDNETTPTSAVLTAAEVTALIREHLDPQPPYSPAIPSFPWGAFSLGSNALGSNASRDSSSVAGARGRDASRAEQLRQDRLRLSRNALDIARHGGADYESSGEAASRVAAQQIQAAGQQQWLDQQRLQESIRQQQLQEAIRQDAIRQQMVQDSIRQQQIQLQQQQQQLQQQQWYRR